MTKVKMVLSAVVLCTVILSALVAPTLVGAQDAMAKVACDATLVTLLLVAEHDYDYLSSQVDNADFPANKIDLGQYEPMIQEIKAMMMAMMGEMTDEEMKAHEAMAMRVQEIMAMDEAQMMDMMKSMMPEGTDMSMMTMLASGDIPGEDPLCAQVRADVQLFIGAHIAVEMEMMGM